MIHRDVKPANIWLEKPGGRVKLLDFGLARVTAEDMHLTTTAAILGTPAYMAPEQARGDKFDHRADLFSLGVVLYRLCAGELPFVGDTAMAVLTALATESPRPIQELVPDVPPALANLIMRLLAKDPSQRPATAKEVVHKIQAIEREPASPPPKRAPPRTDVRRRTQLSATVAVVFAAVGLLAWFFGPTLLQVIEGRGELVVDVEDPDVDVVVEPHGIRVPAGKQQSVAVSAGDGVVEVRDPAHGGTLLTEKFTLKRGSSYMVHVKREAVARRAERGPRELKRRSSSARKSRLSSSMRETGPDSKLSQKPWHEGEKEKPLRCMAMDHSMCRRSRRTNPA